MNRGSSQNRNQQSNRNIGSNRHQNPQALQGVNSRHAPSAGENRGPRNYLKKGEGNGNTGAGGAGGSGSGINLDNFTTSQKNINNAILEYLHKQGYERTSDNLNEEIGQHMSGQLQRSFS